MKFLRHVPIMLGLLWCSTIAAQQPDPLTRFEVKGHVYEPQAVSPTDARIEQLSLPSGFRIHRFAEGLNNPRMLAVAEDGTVYVTQRKPGNLVMLRDLDDDGVADVQKVVLEIKDLHGIFIDGTSIYLVDVNRIHAGTLLSDGGIADLQVISRGIPEAGQHPNRTLNMSPDGVLYVTIGSTCNACAETSPEYATISSVDLVTGERSIFASGLRNTLGFDWHPPSGLLYAMDQGIDWLGNEEQSEELNLIVEDGRYGWPYVYDDDELNPQDEPLYVTQLRWAELSEEPVAGYDAHAAAMQMIFYEGEQFPGEYSNHAFVAMHGSWNRRPPSGYEVVRLKFDSSGDFYGFEPFVTGFLVPQPNREPPLPGAQRLPAEGFIGRPTGVATAGDGSLLISDDSNNMIYRVSYGGSAAKPSPQKLAKEILRARSNQPIVVTSSAFGPGEMIPREYTDYGKGISPPLSWSGLPDDTQSVVLMVEDPDATSPLPFVHWIATGPANMTEVPEDVPAVESLPEAPEARQGSNSRSEIGYFGPRPPAGDSPHAYHFQVFALDKELDLPSGFNRHALLKAMEDHVLAEGELVGTFAKEP
ncbi:MAG TPA: YbhB/YbcL family Raf kinase inhibitor-like protein [Woeseiaceae bacterium]|nr:YbhB/YbcL family Raf kinase inhibitor-like protein [Woeseiaceae bacterium]